MPGVVTTPVPDKVDQVPPPVADKVAVVTLHKFRSDPAFPTGGADTVTVTCALPEQAPLVTVHLKVLAAPTVKPVTPDDGLVGLVTTPLPETVIQFPVVPEPDKLVVVTLHKP